MAGPAPSLPPVPVLETGRLRLRGHTPGDFEALHALWSNPEVTRMISGSPSTEAESQARLLRHIGHWSAFGWGYWAVEDKADGRFLGDVGLGRFRRAITPSIDHMPEIGWVLDPSAQGRGYATEAARAALGWFDAVLPGTRTCCIFHPDNAGSIRVAQKLGYRLWTTGLFMGGETPIYVR